MKTPKSPTDQPASPATSEAQPMALQSAPDCNAIGRMMAMMQFGLHFDVPLPLVYFSDLVSRSTAIRDRDEGRLELEETRSRLAVRPSELARYLKNEPQAKQSDRKAA